MSIADNVNKGFEKARASKGKSRCEQVKETNKWGDEADKPKAKPKAKAKTKSE